MVSIAERRGGPSKIVNIPFTDELIHALSEETRPRLHGGVTTVSAAVS